MIHTTVQLYSTVLECTVLLIVVRTVPVQCVVLTEVTGWVRIQLLVVIRTRANSILMEEKNSDSRWSETAREFLSELSVPQANPTQSVSVEFSDESNEQFQLRTLARVRSIASISSGPCRRAECVARRGVDLHRNGTIFQYRL